MHYALRMRAEHEAEIERLTAERDAYRVRHESYYALEQQVMGLRAALEAYKEYVAFLADAETGMIGLALSHGFRYADEQIRRGEELRAKIAALA